MILLLNYLNFNYLNLNLLTCFGAFFKKFGVFYRVFLCPIPLFHKYLYCGLIHGTSCFLIFFLRIGASGLSNPSKILWNLSTIRFGDSENGDSTCSQFTSFRSCKNFALS